MAAGGDEDASDRESTEQPSAGDSGNRPTASADSSPSEDEPTPAIRRLPPEEQEGNVAGSVAYDEPLEPEPIDLENAVFVLLGVAFLLVFLAIAIHGL